mgnify:CR=1 FL=1
MLTATITSISITPAAGARMVPAPGSTPAHQSSPGREVTSLPTPKTNNLFTPPATSSATTRQHRATTMKALIRTPEGVEEVRDVDSDFIIPGDILDDGSIVLDLWDDLSDNDYLAIGLYD